MGKRAWIDQELPGAFKVDFNDERLLAKLSRNPNLLRQELHSVIPGQWVVIYEIQKLPSLVNEIYPIIAERGIRFALLSSNIRNLKTESNSYVLASRIQSRIMHPLSPADLDTDFVLDEVLRYGSIPSVWNATSRPEMLNYLHSCMQIDLRESIRSELPLEAFKGLIRFVPMAVDSHTKPLNITRIAQECEVEESDVALYLEALEDMMLVRLLPAYRTLKQTSPSGIKKLKKKLRKRGDNPPSTQTHLERLPTLFDTKKMKNARLRPKMYWCDPGLLRAFQNNLDPVSDEEREPLMEGWILGLLRAHNEYLRLYDQITHWSSARMRNTVAFLLTRDDHHVAIDVKSADTYNKDLLDGLYSVVSLSGLLRRILVYNGEQDLYEDNIDVLSIKSFQEALSDNQIWV